MIKVDGKNQNSAYAYRLEEDNGHRKDGHYRWSVAGAVDVTASPEAMDILEVGKAIHLADRAIRRSGGAASRYRKIEVTLPVRCTSKWKSQTDLLETIAEFATGDCWRIRFRRSDAKPSRVRSRSAIDGSIVALFSGGLDSLCGAAYLAKLDGRPIFVGHSPPGREGNQNLIAGVYRAFNREIPIENRFVSFRLEVRQTDMRNESSMFQEMSRRSRPVFFLALAAAVGVATGIRTIQMSENGALALSLPNRFDAHGPSIARQAHSFILEAFAKLIDGITGAGEHWQFINPFESMTKGDACRILGPSAALARKSMSCEYVGHQRAELLKWIADHPSAARQRGMGQGPQCGLCYPCLVRRAALHSANIEDPATDYFADAPSILEQTYRRGSALNLFRGRIAPPLLDTLASNPLYHERFCDDLLEMSVEEFSSRYLAQLRSVRLSPNINTCVSTLSHTLMRRFAKEQLEFLHGHLA